LGITEKTIRNVVNGQSMVELATVERALIADGTHLREVYESWYDAEAAA